MGKKLFRIFAVALIFAGFLQQSALAVQGISNYNEYTPSPWAQEATIHLQYYGIIPEEDVLNSDFAAMRGFKWDIRRDAIAFLLVNLYEYKTGTNLSATENYPLDKWIYNGFEDSVKKAYGIGLMQGRSATDFGYTSLTRQEFAVVLYRAAKILDCFNGDANSYNPSDADEIAPWAKGAVSYVHHEGILIGTSDDTFSPTDFLAQEMAYTAIHRFALANGIYDKLPAEYITSYEFIKPHMAGDVDQLCAAVSDEEAKAIRMALKLFPNAYEVHAYTADMAHSKAERNIFFPGEADSAKGEYGRLLIYAQEGDFALILTEMGIYCSMTFSNTEYSKYKDLVYEIIAVSRYTDIYLERFEYTRQRAKSEEYNWYYEAEGYWESDRIAFGTWACVSVGYNELYDGIHININDIYIG